MARTFDLLCCLSQLTSQPAPTTSPAVEISPGAVKFQTTIIAIGLCVLAVWIVRRLANRQKFTLSLAPNRPNSLGAAQIVGVLLMILVIDSLVQMVAMRWFGNPNHDTMAYSQAAIVANCLARLPELAIVLYVADKAFRFGLVNGLGLSMRHWLADSVRGLLALLAVYPICAVLSKLSQVLIPEMFHRTHFILTFLQMPEVPAGWKLLAVLTAAIVAPVFEEVFFRGILQSALRQHLNRPWLSIAIVSVLFGLIHIDFSTLKGLPDVAPLIFLALALGYNYERCGRLWPNILMHMLFNSINLATFLWPR